MSVPDQESANFYTANGITTTFPYGFYLLTEEDLVVSIDGVVQTNGYTVTGVGAKTGGSVVFSAAPADQASVLLERQVALERTTDYQPNGDLRSDVLNTDFDRIWMVLQDKRHENTRSLRYPNDENISGLLPNAATRANHVLGFADNGTHTMLPMPSSFGAGDMRYDVFTEGVDFTGGVTTSLTLSRDPGTPDNVVVFFDGVFQGPDQWGVSGSTLNFTAPIPAGFSKVFVRTGTALSVTTPAPRSVGDDELSWGNVLSRVADSIAELRGLSHVYYRRAFVVGYYAPGDGGGGAYYLDPSDSTSADNGGSIIVADDGGRWKLVGDTSRVSVRQFGAKGDGLTNDAVAINKAIDHVASVGGGQVIFPEGTFCIGSTLTVSAPGISLVGAGEGGNHDTGSHLATTVLKWIGSAGGKMIELNPSGTQALTRNDVDGFFLDGNSLAGFGLNVISCRNSIHRISGRHCTVVILNYTSSNTLLEAADCQNNDIWLTGYQTAVGDGVMFACTGTATANFSFNRVRNISGNYRGNAIIVGNSDSNVFEMIRLVAVPGYTGNGVVLQGNADINQTCRGNKFYLCDPGAGGLYSQGVEAGQPANGNEVLAYNTGNGAPVPILGLNTSLYWSDQALPVGYRQASVTTTPDQMSVEVNSLGFRRYFGVTASIAGGASRTLTYPTAFSSAVVRASASPSGAGVAYQINPTLTNVTIVNNGGVAATFYFEVEGS